NGTLVYHCNGDSLSAYTPATIHTEQGHFIPYPDGLPVFGRPSIAAPYSERIETLPEEGNPATIADNTSRIDASPAALPQVDSGRRGCGMTHRRTAGGATLIALVVLVRLAGRRRRRA